MLKTLAAEAKQRMKPPPQPEPVTSTTEKLFNQDEYKELCERYLEPPVRKNHVLPGGITIRQQTGCKYIDRPTPQFKKLKQKIESLLKANNQTEVYRFFCLLREWEMNPKRNELWRELGFVDEEGVNELVDLTAADKSCVDVEKEAEKKPVHAQSVTSAVREVYDCATDDEKEMITTPTSNDKLILSEKGNMGISTATPAQDDPKIKPDIPTSSSIHEKEHNGAKPALTEAIDCIVNDSNDKAPGQSLLEESTFNETNIKSDDVKLQPKEEPVYIFTTHPYVVNITYSAVDIIEKYLTKKIAIIKPLLRKNRDDTFLADCRRKLEYERLERRYLTPQIIENPQIGSGMTIRRKRGGRFIDQPTGRFNLLRAKIDSLLKTGKRDEVYTILRQLQKWEENPSWDKVWSGLGVDDEEDDEVLIDLCGDEDSIVSKQCTSKRAYSKSNGESSSKELVSSVAPDEAKQQFTAGCNIVSADELSNATSSVISSIPIQPAASILVKLRDTSIYNGNQARSIKKPKLKGFGLEFLATTARSFGKDSKDSFKYIIDTAKREHEKDLADGWKLQGKKRRKGEWKPSGHITGKWKGNVNASNNVK